MKNQFERLLALLTRRETGDRYILRGRESGTQYPSTTVLDAVKGWVFQGLLSLAVTVTCCYRHCSKPRTTDCGVKGHRQSRSKSNISENLDG